jgi:hypothetical protein
LLSVIPLVILACNLQFGTQTNVPAGATVTVSTAPGTQATVTGVSPTAPTPPATEVATAQPTATQGPPPAVTISVVGGRLNVRRGPGPEYDTVAAFLDGQSRMATGRNGDGTWLLISGPNTSTSLGWVIVTTKYTSVTGEVTGLPVVTVAPAAAAYIRNCTPHEMLVNPIGVLLPGRGSSPENQLQFYPGEYSVIDQTSESEVASVTVFEGRTVDIRKDSSGTSYTCP